MRVALSLPGGGLSGALYQVGALAALTDAVGETGFDLYLGQAGGSVVAAYLAGGVPVDRLYRALLDPGDDFFPIERRTVLAVDVDEYRRMIRTGLSAARRALVRLRPGQKSPDDRLQDVVFEQLDRFGDSLPAGLFSLSRFERFLSDVFLRRDVPNVFSAMPRALRIPAHDLDSGERVLFGAPGFETVPVSLACAASCAMPLFFSPVRIGGRHYVDGGLCSTAHLDAVVAAGAELAIVVSPRVPVGGGGAIPTGHGPRGSVRDKGMAWVYNQARRISARAHLEAEVALVRREESGGAALRVLVIEPDAEDTRLFLNNPANPAARRMLLEYAYRTTRARISSWLARHAELADRLGWRVPG